MLKLYKILILLIVFSSQVTGQKNLVKNPSFEFMSVDSVWGNGQYDLLDSVWNPNYSSVDLMTRKSIEDCVCHAPHNNTFGYQEPRTGDNYIATYLFTMYHGTFYRPYEDFYGGEFYSTLEKDKIYEMEFFINIPDSLKLFSNALDVVLTKDTLIEIDNYSNYGYKVWSMDTIFSDSSNWNKVSFCFKAKGNENAVAIGNFHDTTQILFSKTPEDIDVYVVFLDDVSLKECPSCCVDQFPIEENVTVTYNLYNSTSLISFEIILNPETTGILEIFDSRGRLIDRQSYHESLNYYIPPKDLKPAMYFYSFELNNGEKQSGKFIIPN